MLRAAGSSVIRLPFSTSCRTVLCTSTMGASPVMVIVSWTPPRRMSTFTVAVKLPGEFNPLSIRRRESLQREADPISAGRKIGDPILTGAIGDAVAHLLDQRTARRVDRDPGKNSTRSVPDRAGDGCLREYGNRGGRHEHSQADHQCLPYAFHHTDLQSAASLGFTLSGIST